MTAVKFDRRSIVVVLAAAVLAGFALAAAPAGSLPVDIGVATGPSMGYDSPQAVVYADLPVDQGDRIVFRANDGDLVHHRAVRQTPEGWITKGDTVPHADQDLAGSLARPHATEANTAGVVVSTAPLGDVRAGLLVGLGILSLVVAGAVATAGDRAISVNLAEMWRNGAEKTSRRQTSQAVVLVVIMLGSVSAAPLLVQGISSPDGAPSTQGNGISDAPDPGDVPVAPKMANSTPSNYSFVYGETFEDGSKNSSWTGGSVDRKTADSDTYSLRLQGDTNYRGPKINSGSEWRVELQVSVPLESRLTFY